MSLEADMKSYRVFKNIVRSTWENSVEKDEIVHKTLLEKTLPHKTRQHQVILEI